MRNFMMAALLAMVLGCSSAADDIVLNFEVASPTAGEVVLVYDSKVMQFPLDGDGRAQAVLDADALYARLFYGREDMNIYMERGDRADIRFDGHDFKGTFVFDGEKSQVVRYLSDVKLTALPDEDYALPFDEFLEKTEAKAADAVKLLEANGLGSIGFFEEMEKGRIRYSYASTLLMYPIGHMMMAGDMAYQPDDSYYEVIRSYFSDDSRWVDLEAYRSFMIEAAHVLDPENRNVTSPYQRAVAQMRFIADNSSDTKVREMLLHGIAATYVDRHGIDDITELENIYKTYVRNETLLADYAVKYDKWDVSKPGRISPDFEAADINGKVWSLEDFRGRYVYIDMWATWCNPCRRELPYLKSLEEKFSDAEIVFLGLSIDRDKAKWEEMVRSGSLVGTQLYLGSGSSFQKAYNIEGIPRFILLGKDGRIVNPDMSRPSQDETLKTLESLEGIR